MSTPLSNPLHLFRAILREATYLPDVAARTFHARHVVASFQRHRSDLEVKDGSTSCLPSKQESHQMKRARKYLYTLQRANQGYMKNLENVLKMTYARKGKRRRKMMQDLMARDPANVKSSLNSSERWKPSHEFTILLRKQNKIQDYFDRRSIKQLPKIPTHTRSNKPFPKKRAQKMLEKWYARHAAIIQVPLTEAEWLSIYRKATGQSNDVNSLMRKRRPLASVCVFAGEDVDQLGLQNELEFIACTSTQTGPAQRSRRVGALLGNPHKLTRRFLRRIIRRSVLQASPTVIVDVETGKLAPRWDIGTTPHFQPRTVTASQSLSMFY